MSIWRKYKSDDQKTSSKLPMITNIPKAVPTIVGNFVPASGSVGWSVGEAQTITLVAVAVVVGVVVGQRQLD